LITASTPPRSGQWPSSGSRDFGRLAGTITSTLVSEAGFVDLIYRTTPNTIAHTGPPARKRWLVAVAVIAEKPQKSARKDLLLSQTVCTKAYARNVLAV
jgi:hypothetical protein